MLSYTFINSWDPLFKIGVVRHFPMQNGLELP